MGINGAVYGSMFSCLVSGKKSIGMKEVKNDNGSDGDGLGRAMVVIMVTGGGE